MNSICCGNENSASKFSLKRQNSDFWLLNTSIPFSFSSKLLSQPLWCFFTKSLLFFRYTMLFQPFKLFYIWDFLFPGIPFNLLTAWQNVGNPSTRCYSLAWEHHQQHLESLLEMQILSCAPGYCIWGVGGKETDGSSEEGHEVRSGEGGWVGCETWYS